MQNKGVIRLFAIAFSLACLFELSFTWVAQRVESQAQEVAAGDADKANAYLDSMMTQNVYDLGIVQYTFKEVKNREINLGLDLRGGMNVILEVSVKDVLKGISNNSNDPMFVQALANTDKAQTESQDNYFDLFLIEIDKLRKDSGRKLSDPALFGTKEMAERVGFNASDEDIINAIRGDIEASIENVYTVLKARIDQFGVVQPNIQRLENSGRILVELPGVKDPARVQRLLQSTARLEFWRTYQGAEVLQYIFDANTKLRDIVERPNKGQNAEAVEGASALDVATIEDNDSTNTSATAAESDSTALAAQDSTNNMFNPLFDVFAPNINRETGAAQEGPIVGFALVKDTAKVNRYLNMQQIRALLPAAMRYVKFAWTRPEGESGEMVFLIALKGNRDNTPELDGGSIIDARNDFDQGNNPVVTMAMDGNGSSIWERITGEEAAKDPKGNVAVTLDNIVYSYPRVNDKISGGRTEISGGFTLEEAKDLANVLKAGKLPVPAKVIQADVVGPTLGKEAISASLNSFMVALLIVMVYMIFYYHGAGAVADLSLILNMFFIFGILDAIGAVLTLPGMAGIVLTIGMAVDANVIIYERIREELASGKGIRLAIADGYKQSYAAIVDANVTTLLTGIILYAFGTGPIRGFATTLIIGILTSLFCAIFITRLTFEWRLKKKEGIKFSTKASEGLFKNIKIDWLSKRKTAYGISAILIIISLVSIFTKGLNLGVDFSGGRTYQVRFDQPVATSDIAQSLGDIFVDADGKKYVPVVKTLGEVSQVVITTNYRINETGAEVEDEMRDMLYKGVQSYYGSQISEDAFFSIDESPLGLVASRQVGPTIADDIKDSAFWALILSLAGIFLYIFIRFRKWQFSLGAVLATMHDAIIVVGIFSLLDGLVPFQLEVDQAFIAAILTVIGYSLNDTVVVFDRIREYFSHFHAKRSDKDILNGALNGTLSRTINTSMTTLVVLLIIFLFGGEVIRGFMFAILIGILVGTYSSLFIATPIYYDTTRKEDKE